PVNKMLMKRLLFQSYVIAIVLCYCCPIVGIAQTDMKSVVQKKNSTTLSTAGADSSKRAAIKKYYSLAKQYKDGNDVTIDYVKAYYYFFRAAELGNPQSIYAVGYMKYKGL